MRQLIGGLFMISALGWAQNYNPCSQPVQQNWCDSAPPGSDITVLAVNLSPNPFLRGVPAEIAVTSIDSKSYDITKATYSLVLNYTLENGTKVIPVINMSGSVGCPQLGELLGSATCPVQPYAERTVSFSFVIPKFLPPGTYSGSVTLKDQNNTVIQAIQFSMPVH